MKWDSCSLFNRGISTAFYLIIMSEVVLTVVLFNQVDQVRTEIKISEKALQVLNSSEPTVSPENLDAIKSNLAQLQAQFDTFILILKNRTTTLQLMPAHYTQSQHLYFDIVAFIENYTKRARELNIEINEGEKFGFYEIERSGRGPEVINLEHVYHQRVIIAHLLSKLFVANPQKILAVYREPVFSHSSIDLRSSDSFSKKDFFKVDSSISAKIPNTINTMGFQFVFAGQTRTLRSFLTQLASFDLPVVVRSVEVRSYEEREENPSPKLFSNQMNKKQVAMDDNKPLPIIGKNLSKFTVTLEFIDILEKATMANS